MQALIANSTTIAIDSSTQIRDVVVDSYCVVKNALSEMEVTRAPTIFEVRTLIQNRSESNSFINSRTVRYWCDVLKGEDEEKFPFSGNNTSHLELVKHIYELIKKEKSANPTIEEIINHSNLFLKKYPFAKPVDSANLERTLMRLRLRYPEANFKVTSANKKFNEEVLIETYKKAQENSGILLPSINTIRKILEDKTTIKFDENTIRKKLKKLGLKFKTPLKTVARNKEVSDSYKKFIKDNKFLPTFYEFTEFVSQSGIKISEKEIRKAIATINRYRQGDKIIFEEKRSFVAQKRKTDVKHKGFVAEFLVIKEFENFYDRFKLPPTALEIRFAVRHTHPEMSVDSIRDAFYSGKNNPQASAEFKTIKELSFAHSRRIYSAIIKHNRAINSPLSNLIDSLKTTEERLVHFISVHNYYALFDEDKKIVLISKEINSNEVANHLNKKDYIGVLCRTLKFSWNWNEIGIKLFEIDDLSRRFPLPHGYKGKSSIHPLADYSDLLRQLSKFPRIEPLLRSHLDQIKKCRELEYAVKLRDGFLQDVMAILFDTSTFKSSQNIQQSQLL